ncbi:hypothetical protein D1872_269010 [compost metagenome]
MRHFLKAENCFNFVPLGLRSENVKRIPLPDYGISPRGDDLLAADDRRHEHLFRQVELLQFLADDPHSRMDMEVVDLRFGLAQSDQFQQGMLPRSAFASQAELHRQGGDRGSLNDRRSQDNKEDDIKEKGPVR